MKSRYATLRCSRHSYWRIAMRNIPLALLVGTGLLASVLAVAGQQATGNRAYLVEEAPNFARLSGPSQITCRRPEQAALAKELGHRLCVQNGIVNNLNTRAPSLQTAARAFLSRPWRTQISDDPKAIICRGHVPVHTITCAYNSYWTERAAASARAYAQSTPVFQTGMPAP